MVKKNQGIVYGLLSALFVTGYFIVNRYVYTHYGISSVEYSLLFAISGAVFALFSLLTKVSKENIKIIKNNIVSLIILGFAGNLAVGILVAGQQHTSAINASILMTTTIISTMFFSYLMLSERFEKAKYLWIGCLFLGLYLSIVGLKSFEIKSGDIMIISSIVFFGFGNAYSRKLMVRMGSASLVPDARLLVGGVIALPLYLAVINSTKVIIEILPLVLLAGFFYWLTIKTFAKSVYLTNANNTIILNNTHIFTTSIAGVLLLSETYTVEKLIGSIIAILAIYKITSNNTSHP